MKQQHLCSGVFVLIVTHTQVCDRLITSAIGFQPWLWGHRCGDWINEQKGRERCWGEAWSKWNKKSLAQIDWLNEKSDTLSGTGENINPTTLWWVNLNSGRGFPIWEDRQKKSIEDVSSRLAKTYLDKLFCEFFSRWEEASVLEWLVLQCWLVKWKLTL